MLAARAGPAGNMALEALVAATSITAISFTQDHWRLARSAFTSFGKGRHPAALNFGDCLSYATARLAAQPLLCVGDDFPLTDLPLVEVPRPRPGGGATD